MGKKKTTAAPVPLVSAPPPHPATNATDFSIGCDAYLPSEDDYEPSIPEPPPPSNSAPQPKARMDDMVTVRTKTYKTPTVPNRVTSKVQQVGQLKIFREPKISENCVLYFYPK